MKIKILFIFITTLFFMSLGGTAHAKFTYTLLESFPGFFTSGTAGPELPTMILAIYKFGIWTVGIAGLFMLVIGGFWYMTSAGNNATAETAKKIIADSLLGIVAALAAYLIMYVINPDLTKINIAFTPVTVTPGAVPGAAPTTPVAVTLGGALPAGTLTDTDARAQLSAAGIGVNKQNCATSTDTDCTSLDGIPSAAITDVISLKNACGCSVTITGGTEAGHLSHGPGQAKLDVRSDATLKSFLIQQEQNSSLGTYGINQVCATPADADVRYNCSTDEVASHYHLSFNN